MLKQLNTRGGIRTHAVGLLRSSSLPLDYSGLNAIIILLFLFSLNTVEFFVGGLYVLYKHVVRCVVLYERL